MFSPLFGPVSQLHSFELVILSDLEGYFVYTLLKHKSTSITNKMFGFTKIAAVVSLAAALVGAAPTVYRRQNACFLVGKTALPAEVASGISALTSALT